MKCKLKPQSDITELIRWLIQKIKNSNTTNWFLFLKNKHVTITLSYKPVIVLVSIPKKLKLMYIQKPVYKCLYVCRSFIYKTGNPDYLSKGKWLNYSKFIQ